MRTQPSSIPAADLRCRVWPGAVHHSEMCFGEILVKE